MGGSATGVTAGPNAAPGGGKGGSGGQAATPAVTPPMQGQYSPMTPTGGFNVNQAAAGSLQQAIGTAGGLANFQAQRMQAAGAGPTATYGGATVERTQGPQAAQLGPMQTMEGVGAVGSAQAPGQISVDQLRTMDISQYMNPYTQNVIETGQADIERQRQMASNTLGAQAQAAGAFGGSRQAVQEGVLAGEALRQAGALSAQQRQANFMQAMESGKFDIGQTQAARTLSSQQQFLAEQYAQQAREAAAARQQQAGQLNMAALNQGNLAQAGFVQAAGLQGASQDAARAAQQAGLTQASGISNQNAINQAVQAQAARQQAANQANFGGQFQTAGVRAGAAGQLGQLGQQAFQTGRTISQDQMTQGLMQQGLQQSLIDAARGQYTGFTGAPQASLGLPLAALGAQPDQSTTTQSKNPGLFDYLSLAATAAGGL